MDGIVVLPQETLEIIRSSCDVRFGRLLHPRTALPSLFVLQPTRVLELQAISPNTRRSWMMPENAVISNGDLYIMTPMEPIFLLIPIFQAMRSSEERFRTLDDILEVAFESIHREHPSIVSRDILLLAEIPGIQSAAKCICEYKGKYISPDLTVFRFSLEKLMQYLERKITRLSNSAAVDLSRTLQRQLAKDNLLQPTDEQLLESSRIKIACELLSQYLPSELYSQLSAIYDFTTLNAHMAALEAQQSLQTITNTEKATTNDDTNNGHKKRKAASQASKGVEKLKKASTKGMAKISSFFGPPGKKETN